MRLSTTNDMRVEQLNDQAAAMWANVETPPGVMQICCPAQA